MEKSRSDFTFELVLTFLGTKHVTSAKCYECIWHFSTQLSLGWCQARNSATNYRWGEAIHDSENQKKKTVKIESKCKSKNAFINLILCVDLNGLRYETNRRRVRGQRIVSDVLTSYRSTQPNWVWSMSDRGDFKFSISPRLVRDISTSRDTSSSSVRPERQTTCTKYMRHGGTTNSFVLARLKTQHAAHTGTRHVLKHNADQILVINRRRRYTRLRKEATSKRRRKTSCNTIDPCYEYDHAPGGRTK